VPPSKTAGKYEIPDGSGIDYFWSLSRACRIGEGEKEGPPQWGACPCRRGHRLECHRGVQARRVASERTPFAGLLTHPGGGEPVWPARVRSPTGQHRALTSQRKGTTTAAFGPGGGPRLSWPRASRSSSARNGPRLPDGIRTARVSLTPPLRHSNGPCSLPEPRGRGTRANPGAWSCRTNSCDSWRRSPAPLSGPNGAPVQSPGEESPVPAHDDDGLSRTTPEGQTDARENVIRWPES
jgi:hypothetical protein